MSMKAFVFAILSAMARPDLGRIIAPGYQWWLGRICDRLDHRRESLFLPWY